MTDRHGRPIAAGARVKVLKRGSGLHGQVGTAMVFMEKCGAVRNRPGVLVIGGGQVWEVWAEPGDVEVLDRRNHEP